MRYVVRTNLLRLLVFGTELLAALLFTWILRKHQYGFFEQYLNNLFLLNIPFMALAVFNRMRSKGVLNTFLYGLMTVRYRLSSGGRYAIEQELGTKDVQLIKEHLKEKYLYRRTPSSYADVFFLPTVVIGLGVILIIAFFLT